MTARDAASAAGPAPAADRPSGDSGFEASSFERSLSAETPRRWIGRRRQALALGALLGCLFVFLLARWLAATPQLAGQWGIGVAGELVLLGHHDPSLDVLRGHAVRAIAHAQGGELAVDGLLLHRWPRWQVDDALRAEQVRQQQGLTRMLAQAPALHVRLHDGHAADVPVEPRGYGGLGLAFWPLAGLALLLYLFALVLVLARPQWANLPFVIMALCQAANLSLIAVDSTRGLGLPAAALTLGLPWRVALDLCTGAAAVQALALHPVRLPFARVMAALAWCVPALWLAACRAPGLPLWWTAQLACIAMSGSALAVAHLSYRREPNPRALVQRRLAAAALATLVLVTAGVAIASLVTTAAPAVAAGASIAWYLFIASLLLLTPFLARNRQVLREFALLAGVSTVATSLDLLFVAVFALGPFESLAVALFIGVGLYAAVRQWALNHLVGSSVLTTERTFDQLYRAARAVQSQPRRYPQVLLQLLRDVFEPLEVLRVDRVPVRARVVGGGSAMVVPLRAGSEDDAFPAPSGSAALVLRFAQRGQRLFTLEDARLADRVVEQLRRAVAYDAAVERGRSEERQRIAQDLHDDIGARLLTLMYQAPSREMEDYIRHTLQDLKTLTRGLAASEHRLSHAAAEWKADITQRLSAAEVSLDWAFNYDRDRALTVVQWSALTRVLRELVSNALYHGHASHVDVSFALEGTALTLKVADDGQGRAPERWAHGLGLGGVRKRVKSLGGEVAWHENGERGIRCEVRVPEFGNASPPPAAP